MLEKDPSSSNEESSKKRDYNKIAQRQYRKRRQQYIQDLEQQIALLSKSEDVKVQHHRTALQAANDKNLQLSALIVKMAEQLKEESRLRIQQEANELALPVNVELTFEKATTSSETSESEKSHDNIFTIIDADDDTLANKSSAYRDNQIESSYQPPIASAEQINAIAKLIHVGEDQTKIPEHPHFSQQASSFSPILKNLMNECCQTPLGTTVPRRIDLQSFTMARICSLFTGIRETMLDTEFTVSPDIFKPSQLQLTITHPPVIDIIPWASMRDRIILNLSVIDIERFMDDLHEHCNVWGGDPLFTQGWEIGPVFFQKYWFLCDKEMVKTSNFWRRQRGQTYLRYDNLPMS
ncbi:hypothetical protein K450DRAFT_199494 [Umbelopsis ramanniana AG]|uniref:BZIP domain-containing protein n=1 Tax=Umbelopsis ramanniana AG TaxID=1314678 RepID=A0AAD5EAQ6_UMBRA|nr:uncharacterized protein K450DRAFT_199494 [Umbelopsis ramanniana AG]KAI8579491.1 hypothetical protein K450DRAFT_199494 [Umbelopsis ramanniana AG]